MKIDFITIFTDKTKESTQFYQDLLGFTLVNEMKLPDNLVLTFLADEDGTTVELVDSGQTIEKVTNSPVALTIKVENIETALQQVEKANYPIKFGPITLPTGMKMMHILDPNGVIINFIQMK